MNGTADGGVPRWAAAVAALAVATGVGGCTGGEEHFPAAPGACSLVSADTRQRLLGADNKDTENIYEDNSVSGSTLSICTWHDPNREAEITVQVECWWSVDGSGGSDGAELLRERFAKVEDKSRKPIAVGDGGYFIIRRGTQGSGDTVETWFRIRNVSALVRYRPARTTETFEREWRNLATEVAKEISTNMTA